MKDQYGLTLSSGMYIPIFNFKFKPKIEDLIHNLSNECRWNGSCAWHYSVAQHSVYCSKFCIYPYSALMHDIEEALFKDISATIKYHFSIKEYTLASKRCRYNLFEHFNVPWNSEIEKEVKNVDKRMMVTEANQLMSKEWFTNHEMPYFEPFNLQVEKWTPEEAKDSFLKLFGELHDRS